MTKRCAIVACLSVAVVGLHAPAAFASDAPAWGGPALSDAELGHLVNIARLANQPLDDWTGYEAKDQENMEAYRYQMAFAAYALALQQYQCVPAWREVHRATLDRLILRMLQKPVWEFWESVSQTRRDYDPDWEGPQPGKHDPVGEKNIMYSGHLVHMAALYEMLYRDMKWSRPGAFTFVWDEHEKFEYDQQKLLAQIRAEMLGERKAGACIAGVECEPNLIFPECQQHPLLAFRLNDRTHSTALYEEPKAKLIDFFDCTDMYDPKTQAVANAYRLKQAKLVRVPGMPSATADGWTGAFMYSWDPKTVREAYEKQRAANIRRDADGRIKSIAFDPLFELGLGFFALLAVEVGDLKTAEELFDYADRKCGPVREAGGFRYPRQTQAGGEKEKVSNTLDKVLALARSNRPGGLVNLHEKGWGDEEFGYPLVEGIDFPRVLVSEARWSGDRRTLTLEIAPGHEAPAEAAFQVKGVKPGGSWTLTQDGRPVGTSGPDGITSGALRKGAAADTLEIALPLKGRVRVTLAHTE